MAHLEEERAVPKSVATLDTFGAANAKLFIDDVFVIGVLDKCPLNRRRGTQLVFGAGIQIIWFRLEITRAKLAIAANGVCMNTLHCRLLQHATRGAQATADTFLGIDLPDRSSGHAATSHYSKETSKSRQ
jgi:hypothetical protein